MKKPWFFLLFSFLIVMVSCTSISDSVEGRIYPFEKGLRTLTKEIVRGLEDERLYRIAINEFLRVDGTRSLLGAAVSEELTTAFFSTDAPFSIVERSQLDAAIQELQLGMTAVFDEDQAARLGRLIGAEALVIGSITPFDDYIKLNARVFSIEDGRVVSAASVKIARTPEVDAMLNNTTRPGGTSAATGSPRPADRPAFVQRIDGFSVELTALRREGSKLWADFIVTYQGDKQEEWIGFFKARLIDSAGKSFPPTDGGTMRLTDDWGGLTCVKDVPTAGTVPFDVGSVDLQGVNLLEIEFRDRGKLQFKNIPIPVQ